MSKILKNSELDISTTSSIVSETLNNCDDGELYLEDSKSESIVLDDNKIKSSSYKSDLGYGLRAITGDIVAYSHSSDLSKKSLIDSSNNLKSTLYSANGTFVRIPLLCRYHYHHIWFCVCLEFIYKYMLGNISRQKFVFTN